MLDTNDGEKTVKDKRINNMLSKAPISTITETKNQIETNITIQLANQALSKQAPKTIKEIVTTLVSMTYSTLK